MLDKGSPPSARLALILVDNIAEVVMYQRVRLEFAEDQVYSSFRPPRYAAKKRPDVLYYFNPKIKFLRSEINILDLDDANFLKFGHALRNEAYHKDEYHRDIVIPVAQTYFATVCRLYPRIRIPAVFSSGSQAEREFLERHGLSDPVDLTSGGLERICNELAAKRPCDPIKMASALSGNLVRRIDGILGTKEEAGLLETLTHAQFDVRTNIDDVLKRILFAESYAPEAGSVQTDDEYHRAIEKVESEFEKFKPRATVKTLRKWRETARSLASESNPSKVAERYSAVERKLTGIEESVHQAVQEFDAAAGHGG